MAPRPALTCCRRPDVRGEFAYCLACGTPLEGTPPSRTPSSSSSDSTLASPVLTSPVLAEAPVSGSYAYTPLNKHEREIRLLRLLPGWGEDDIHCEFTYCLLRNCPKYQAVSYTWDRYDGDFGRVEKVFCGPDRDVVPVTRNCLAALQYLRRQYETRTLWLDMLCIDQSNADERNHQVSLMKEIYFNASEVLIYMGESVENFELISRLSWPGSNQKACLRDGADERRASLKAVKEFLSRRWFTRVWVLQEVAVARRATVICGFSEVPWTMLEAQIFKRAEEDPSVRSTVPGALRVCLGLYDKGMSLLGLLHIARTCRASDDRDKVYALLGLASGIDGHLTVDYGLPVKDVYLGVAYHLLRTTASLDLLSLARSPAKSSALPSWVPDWSLPMDVAPLVNLNLLQIKQSPQSDTSVTNTSGTLKLRGHKVDVVLRGGKDYRKQFKPTDLTSFQPRRKLSNGQVSWRPVPTVAMHENQLRNLSVVKETGGLGWLALDRHNPQGRFDPRRLPKPLELPALMKRLQDINWLGEMRKQEYWTGRKDDMTLGSNRKWRNQLNETEDTRHLREFIQKLEEFDEILRQFGHENSESVQELSLLAHKMKESAMAAQALHHWWECNPHIPRPQSMLSESNPQHIQEPADHKKEQSQLWKLLSPLSALVGGIHQQLVAEGILELPRGDHELEDLVSRKKQELHELRLVFEDLPALTWKLHLLLQKLEKDMCRQPVTKEIFLNLRDDEISHMSPDLGQLTVELKMRSAKRHAQVTPEFLDCTDGDLKEHVRLVHLIKRWKSMTQFKYAFHPDELKRTVERLEVELIGEVVWRLEQEPDPKREMSSTQFLPGDLSPIDILHSRDYWKKVYELFRATKLEQILQTLRKLLGGGGATNKTIMDCLINVENRLSRWTSAPDTWIAMEAEWHLSNCIKEYNSNTSALRTPQMDFPIRASSTDDSLLRRCFPSSVADLLIFLRDRESKHETATAEKSDQDLLRRQLSLLRSTTNQTWKSLYLDEDFRCWRDKNLQLITASGRDNLNLVLADTTLAAILLDPQKLFDCQFHQTKTWELVSVGGTVISEIEAAVLTVPKVETPGYFTGFQGLFAAKAKEPPKREDAVKVKLVEFSCKQTPEEAAQLLWDRLSLPQSGAIPRAFLHPTLGFSGHTLVASRNKDSDGSFLESFTDSPVHGPSITQLEDSYRRHEEGRAFFQAEDSLGFGPNDVKEQDEIWLLQGAKVPYILRKKDDHYILIGECYLQGAMPEEYYTGHYEEPVPMAECYKEKLNADPEEIELQ